MNNKIISLIEFKQQKWLKYRKTHRKKIEQFLCHFVEQNFTINYSRLNQQYLDQIISENKFSWDYQDFRDELRDAIKSVFGDQIWHQINQVSWFNPKLVSKDELIEIAFSIFVLGNDKHERVHPQDLRY